MRFVCARPQRRGWGGTKRIELIEKSRVEMFAQRFDPTAAFGGDEKVKKVLIKPRNGTKRAREVDSDGDSGSDDDDNSSDSSDSDDSSSSSDSDSDSSDDTSASNDSDSDDSSSNDSDSDDSSSSDSDSDDSSDSESKNITEDATPITASSPSDSPAEIPPISSTSKTSNEISPSDDMDVDVPEEDPNYISKHSAIFKKLKKAVKEDDEKPEDDGESIEEDVIMTETQDLAPLPQPELPRDKRLRATAAHSKNLDWLATPTYSSPEHSQPFEDFPLSSFMLKNLKSMGYDHAFSVQVSILSLMMAEIKSAKIRPDSCKGDILVNASTGSGKTLAYSIPIVESLHTRVVPRVRAVVLVPTKPLISQVRTTMMQLAKGTNLSVVSLKNDKSIADEGAKLLANEPDIIVSTPGRLVEHIQRGSISLKALEYLVIDEADRLLNQSFQDWCQVLVSTIAANYPAGDNISNQWMKPTQKLIFSATLTTDAGKLASLKLQSPRLIIVNDQKQLVNEVFSVPQSLSEFKIQIGTSKASLKPLIVAKFLLQQQKNANVLIFTKSNDSSLRLAHLLTLIFQKLNSGEHQHTVAYLNSTNNTASSRTKILKDFGQQKINIVVATDLIARGIDLLSIETVINYDLPNSSREYVHRVGRTARANQVGSAYTFCFGKGEGKWYKKLMREVGRGEKNVEDIEVNTNELLESNDEDIYDECLQELQKSVRGE
ncbi:ATP-dependent RNA helicase Dbp6p [[Candida] anglica]|uniref:RNA helicase n=1 Tax=[Candida] anglica TaxID=148631 RepID=A0ABP0EF62_9ASCO